MSLESILRRLRSAFETLNRGARPDQGPATERPVARPRSTSATSAVADVVHLPRDGFAEEALPWMGAVHRFAIRLTRGDEAAASDLVQETFLLAYRSWHLYSRGTNCRSWLFTICKNTHVKLAEKAATRRSFTDGALELDVNALAVEEVSLLAERRGVESTLGRLVDEEVVQAIDDLPDEFRDVLVLSDLGDLRYDEIAQVLELPLGTVKSRLYRARRLLQVSLVDYAADRGFGKEAPHES